MKLWKRKCTSTLTPSNPFTIYDNVVVTRISTLAADQPYFHVSESVDEVMQMIRRSELCLM